MFFLLMIIYGMLIIVAFFGDYEEKERKKDYEDYNRIVKGEKKWKIEKRLLGF